jgi:hypothetical protein
VCDWYEVHEYRFGLRSTSEAFAGWLRYALAAYLTEPTLEEEDRSPTYSIVVEDDTPSEGRVGRGYNILYVGTTDIARTLDLRFLARCLLRQIDAIGYHARDDALFLESGLVEVGGSPHLVPAILVPMLSKSRRRAEKRGLYAPGGRVAALDLDTGELVAPPLSLEIPADALDRLAEHMPSMDGVRDRFPIEDGERRMVGAVIGLGPGQQELVSMRPRSETVLDLVVNAMNLKLLGGRALRSLATMAAAADCRTVTWSSTHEMIEVIAMAAATGTAPAVQEIRPGVDEQRRNRP